jgi:hypothetical protein
MENQSMILMPDDQMDYIDACFYLVDDVAQLMMLPSEWCFPVDDVIQWMLLPS